MFTDQEEQIIERPKVVVAAPAHGFVLKYIDREFDREVVDALGADEWPADAPVFMLSTCDVYAADGSDIVDRPESAPLDGQSAALRAEREFAARCAERGRVPVILRLPMVIGTGMTGLARTLARGVARGTMLVIRDNEAVVSAVHATDVARVARLIVGREPAEAVTVNVAPSPIRLTDLVLALGVRIKDKRVGSIKPFWAKALYGGSLYRDLTRTVTYDTSAVKALLPDDFEFVNPAEYLTTHVYDHESL